MRVATPPMEAAYAIPSMSAIPNSKGPSVSWGRNISATARAMGSIMVAVAVFEIHMDRNAVPSMKPRMMRFGLVPT